MTQPQDKMRADVPMQMLQELFDAATDAGNLLFLPWRDVREMRNQAADRINSAIAAIRSLPCAQQSAQSQQDALDAARYRWLRDRSSTRDGMTDCQAVARMVGFTQFPTLTMESRLHDPDAAIDALIATQGASNV